MGKQHNDPFKKMDEPAEEQQLEKHNTVDEDSEKTAQIIEDEKLEEEKKRSEEEMSEKDDSEKDERKRKVQLEDKDMNKITNKDNDIVNKRGQ